MDTNQQTDRDGDSDRELLRRFAELGDEAAFRGLVGRHAAMVRGVALRCAGDATLAEEVAQSVFFLLARRAAAVPADHLSGWLHRAAFLTARNARRKSRRYRQALHELGRRHDVMKDSSADPDSLSRGSPWEDIRPYLDEAVARLPERARTPLMMRFFESRSIRDIASETGSSEAAVRKALERALHRLSGLLRRRGITTNGAALGVMLSAQALLAPPASAAALAAGALSASAAVTAAAGATLFLANPLRFLLSSAVVKTAALAVLLASVPAALLWRQNADLRRELDALKHSVSAPKPAAAISVSALLPRERSAQAPAPPREKAPDFPPGDMAEHIREKTAKEAQREVARISLYLPELTEDQRERLLKFYQERGMRREEAFERAKESGAFARLVDGGRDLTPEDKTLLRASDAWARRDEEDAAPLQAILTGEQYAVHLQAMERRRVSDAEGVAADTLRNIGQSFDLTPEQKDAIYEAVAHFELAPSEAGTEAFPFDGVREERRDLLVRDLLTPDQATLFDQKREEDRQRRERFLQRMDGGPPGDGRGRR